MASSFQPAASELPLLLFATAAASTTGTTGSDSHGRLPPGLRAQLAQQYRIRDVGGNPAFDICVPKRDHDHYTVRWCPCCAPD
jgi:hypothetical protein